MRNRGRGRSGTRREIASLLLWSGNIGLVAHVGSGQTAGALAAGTNDRAPFIVGRLHRLVRNFIDQTMYGVAREPADDDRVTILVPADADTGPKGGNLGLGALRNLRNHELSMTPWIFVSSPLCRIACGEYTNVPTNINVHQFHTLGKPCLRCICSCLAEGPANPGNAHLLHTLFQEGKHNEALG